MELITLLQNATVLQARIEAIYEASQVIIGFHEELGIKYINIMSDSQGSISALHNTRIRSI